MRFDSSSRTQPRQRGASLRSYVTDWKRSGRHGSHSNQMVGAGTASALAAEQGTSVVPIVLAGAGDPVSTGFVVRLARPGGDVAGLSLQQSDLAGKQLELLRGVVPALRRLAILANAGNPVTLLDLRKVEAAAGHLGLE